jgi:hypothetical protein
MFEPILGFFASWHIIFLYEINRVVLASKHTCFVPSGWLRRGVTPATPKTKTRNEKDDEKKCLLLDGVCSKLSHIAEYLALTPSISSIDIHLYIQGPT